jgi:hypothetical protein
MLAQQLADVARENVIVLELLWAGRHQREPDTAASRAARSPTMPFTTLAPFLDLPYIPWSEADLSFA